MSRFLHTQEHAPGATQLNWALYWPRKNIRDIEDKCTGTMLTLKDINKKIEDSRITVLMNQKCDNMKRYIFNKSEY